MKGFGNQNKSKKIDDLTTKQYHHQILNNALKNHSNGNISQAGKCYQYLIDNGFEDTRVFNNYGMILIRLGKLKDAELSIRKAIELNPKDAEAHSNLGIILFHSIIFFILTISLLHLITHIDWPLMHQVVIKIKE